MGEGQAFSREPLFAGDTVRQRVILCLRVIVVPMEAQVHLTEFSQIIAEAGMRCHSCSCTTLYSSCSHLYRDFLFHISIVVTGWLSLLIGFCRIAYLQRDNNLSQLCTSSQLLT